MPKFSLKFSNFMKVAEEHGFISPLVRLSDFKKNCHNVLDSSQMDFQHQKEFSAHNLAEEMGVNEETVTELEEVCCSSSLVCPRENEITNWEDPTIIPDDTGLVTLEHWRKLCEERQETKYNSHMRFLKSKYTEHTCAMYARVSEILPKDASDVVSCPETIITVCVCFPRDNRRFKACGVDFYVLGSQKLAELRDKIPCTLDEQPLGDFTTAPDLPRDIKLKDICTSSLFFIEDTFYNDQREATSFDLSKYLIEWSESTPSIIPPDVQSVDMSDYTFDDLNVRLGKPYIFLHQGDCEHIVTFKDIRIFHASDCQSRSSYPLTISKAHFKANPCQICKLNLATWTTRSDSLAESDPAFFCDRCFRTLHYDKQGNRLGEFTVFPRINAYELDY